MKIFWTIFISVIVTAVLAAGGVYWYLTQDQGASVIDRENKTAISHDIQIAYDSPKTKAIVTNNGELAAEIAINEDGGVLIMKQTKEYVYLEELLMSGLGGYILYDYTWPVYRLNLADNTLDKLGDQVSAISPSEDTIAYIDSNESPLKLVVKDISSKEQKIFDLPNEFHAAGSIHFSPNGQKIGLAASIWNPEDEKSNVFIANLASGRIEKQSDENVGGTIRIFGWINNDEFSWTKNYSPSY